MMDYTAHAYLGDSYSVEDRAFLPTSGDVSVGHLDSFTFSRSHTLESIRKHFLIILPIREYSTSIFNECISTNALDFGKDGMYGKKSISLYDRVIGLAQTMQREISFLGIANELESVGLARNANRILELYRIDDSEEGEEPISLMSAKGYKDFIKKFKIHFQDLEEPLLGLFSTGTLCADWKVAKDKYLVIDFQSEDSLAFSLITPDGSSLNGQGYTHKKLIDTLLYAGVGEW